MTIADYLERVKERLLDAPIVSSFYIIRERVELFDGYLRARLTLKDGSFLEFSEYAWRTAGEQIEIATYSYHWADAGGKLIRRWDNTPHFPDLPGFPHHIHDGLTGEVTPGHGVDIFVVLDEITQRLS